MAGLVAMGLADAFAIIAPVFAIIALGYAVAWRGLISEATSAGLNFFIFTLAIPVLLFHALTQLDVPPALPWRLWGSYFGAALLLWLMAGLVFFLSGYRRREVVLLAFTAANANTMLIGLPVILLALGEQALVPLLLLYTFHMLIPLTGVIIGLELRPTGGSWRQSLRMAFGQALTNPLLIAVATGLLVAAFALPLPMPFMRFTELLGGAAIPGALFIMGVSLAHYTIGGALLPALLLAFLKLLLYPLLVFILGVHLFALPAIDLATATLLAAIPCGVFSFVLAERYHAQPEIISSAVALSTLAALLTLPLVMTCLPVV